MRYSLRQRIARLQSSGTLIRSPYYEALLISGVDVSPVRGREKPSHHWPFLQPEKIFTPRLSLQQSRSCGAFGYKYEPVRAIYDSFKERCLSGHTDIVWDVLVRS
jgi:hypothetical protein